MCPVLGNAYHLAEVADEIRMVSSIISTNSTVNNMLPRSSSKSPFCSFGGQDAVMFKIQRAIDKKQSTLDISEANLYFVPPDLKTLPDLGQLTEINLSHNQLFNGTSAMMFWMVEW